MAQFTIYSSNDAGGPGSLTGQAGSLLAILDACLVNGYPGKAAAGWTKPFTNSGNIGCYRQGAGSMFHLLVNDNGPNVTSTFKEAWVVGWETLAGIGAPVGTGTGQFPTPAQLLTTGHCVVRKSFSADATGRGWILFADNRTFYFFDLTGDSAAVYYFLWFGDVYSIKNTADAYNCFISSGSAENTSSAINHPWDAQSYIGTARVGCFTARSFSGTGTSITASINGDLGLSTSGQLFNGQTATPNGPDAAYYLCPVRICDSQALHVRGRLRGIYHLAHPIANFSDGQTFSGSGTFLGKEFQVILKGPSSGMLVVETSNTLETN